MNGNLNTISDYNPINILMWSQYKRNYSISYESSIIGNKTDMIDNI